MKTKGMLLVGGLIVMGLMVFCAGSADAAYEIGDSFTLSFYNATGDSYTLRTSVSVYISISAGPVLTVTKAQKRRRGPIDYTTDLFTIVANDSVTYRLTITNAADADTATSLIITDTLTFRTAITSGDTLTFVDLGSAGETTAKTGDYLFESGANKGTVTAFEYLYAGDASTWISTTPATLNDSDQIWGIRWTVDKCPGEAGSPVIGNVYFTVKYSP